MSEALRGEGARLVNVNGQPFMSDVHPGGDLAPRDVVARGIARESERTGGPVFLTLAHLDPAFVRRRFPTIAAMCRQVGLDLASDPIPVGPAAHYLMGGVDTDEWGRTSLPGLYAAGEVACTGVHGANRLASNSLLEGLVFGARAARAMTEPVRAAPLKKARVMADGAWPEAHRHPPAISHQPSAMTSNEVRDLMWRSVGLFRIRADLEQAVARLDRAGGAPAAPTADGWRGRNFMTVARLIARAALRREESRGGHCRADFPERDDIHWKVHVVEQVDEENINE
jgi:L-aspartate oxidase